ncbi:MAG: hypothetical protein GEU83_01495 [Pseudonocardiaceae bacterium]|nr:hypothetical protein [Pseudonocardiaceae bacterium]
MISAAAIRRIEGDMDALAEHARAIGEFGVAFADTGRRVHATWQGLAAFYRAPEVAQLLAATAPVAHVAAAVGEDNEIVGRVLGVYAAEVREIQDRLDALRVQAAAFESAVEGDDWGDDPVKVERNSELLRAVDAAMLDFDAAPLCQWDQRAVWGSAVPRPRRRWASSARRVLPRRAGGAAGGHVAAAGACVVERSDAGAATVADRDLPGTDRCARRCAGRGATWREQDRARYRHRDVAGPPRGTQGRRTRQ